MIITCPECATRYQIDGTKFPDEGREVKCTSCSHKWFQRFEELKPAEMPIAEQDIKPKTEFAKPGPDTAGDTDEVATDQKEEAPGEHETQPVNIEQEASRLIKQARVVKSQVKRDKADQKSQSKKALLLCSAFIILFALGIKFRTPVVEKLPQTATLYEKIGLPVNLRGLEFKNVEAVRDFQDGIPVLNISGELVNITEKMQNVASLRYALYNKNNQEVYHWVVPVQTKTIGPKATLPIAARLAAPPPEANRLELRFVRSK